MVRQWRDNGEITSYTVLQNVRGLAESGSFRPYSRSVWSFQPDFRGESFRPNLGGSFRPSFKGGSFRPYLRGESFRPDLFNSGTQVRY